MGESRFGAFALLASLSLGVLSAEAGAQIAEWKPVPMFGERRFFNLAYDLLRQRAVLFGGEHDRDDTWEWDGGGWHHRASLHSPPGREFPGLVYDPVRQTILLFGGYSRLTQQWLGDQWEWDGQDWTQVTPAVMPSPRFGPIMGWDPVRQVVVLFGGHVAPLQASDETWEWDGTSWHLRHPATRPSPRYTTELAFCARNGRMVTVGGQVPGGGTLRDGLTWEWDGVDWRSVASFPWSNPPSTFQGVAFHGLATHPTRGTVIVHSGGLSGIPDLTWEYDGMGWTELRSGAAAFPPDFRYTKLAADWARQEVIAVGMPDLRFSGQRVWGLGADLIWRERWSEEPFFREHAGFAHDAARDEFVMFGYSTIRGTGQLVSRTGLLRESTFSLASPVHQPPPREDPEMIWHVGLQRVFLYGGGPIPTARTDTWLWDGHDWEEHVSTATPRPGATRLAYDSHRNRVVALIRWYGTITTNFETWEWEPINGWNRVTTNTPQLLGQMAYDVANRETLLLGFRDWNFPPGARQNETWTFDGASWQQRITTASPLNSCVGPVYWPEVASLVCFDYDPRSTLLYSGWRWTGRDWVGMPTVGIPGGEVKMLVDALVSDPGRGRLRWIQSTAYGGIFTEPPPQFYVHDLEFRPLRVDQRNPHVGQAVTFTFEDPTKAGRPWLFAVSENARPGLPVKFMPHVGWRRLPIGGGILLSAAGAVVPGLLDSRGLGNVTLPIPNVPALRDFEFTAVAASVRVTPLELGRISNPIHVEIVR